MENMREYWAREAEMMRDKSAVLGTKKYTTGTFQENVLTSSKRIFDSEVAFGSNEIRNKTGLFDTNYWIVNGPSSLKMKNGVQPSKALLSIIDNTSRKQTLDCAQFVQVAYLGSILLTDGEDVFNQTIGGNFILYSFGSTGVKAEQLFSRGSTRGRFAMEKDYDDYINDKGGDLLGSFNKGFDNFTDKTQEQLIQDAPIGSRVTVENFLIAVLAASKDPKTKQFALSIREKAWERENMIKIGDDKYAAFGVGYGVSLEEVYQGLIDEYYENVKHTQKQETDLRDWLSVSQVEYFKRK